MSRERRIPVDTPFDEYEVMRALACPCGGALTWGERTSERLARGGGRHVVDRFTLTCRACGKERRVAFRCDTRSAAYQAMTASALALSAGLGPEGALLAATAGEALERLAEGPRRASEEEPPGSSR